MQNQHLQQIQQKIVSSTNLPEVIAAWRESANTIVFTNGCFDLLHSGHISTLCAAADAGDRLVVGVNSDASVKRLKGSGRPVKLQNERLLLLASLAMVDRVVLFDEDTPLELIRMVKPDILVKGGDYKPEEIVGADILGSYGGKVIIVPFQSGHSTTRLLHRMQDASPE